MVARASVSRKSSTPAEKRRAGNQTDFREFRPQAKSDGLSRWVRILLGVALCQALAGVVVWVLISPRSNITLAGQPMNLTVFADQSTSILGLEINPSDIAVLIISSGQRAKPLQECLQSLSRVSGFDHKNVLVAQETPNSKTRDMVKYEFTMAWIGPEEDSAAEATKFQPLFRGPATPTAHMKRSLDHAVWRHFLDTRFRTLLVLEEDMIFSPDMLWYFAQLAPLLLHDASLWCVSGWHDNGFAPYVRDPTVVMRTDWFSTIGWMMRLETIRGELMSKWPETGSWRQWLRVLASNAGRQCAFPEVPRLAFSELGCAFVHPEECGEDEIFARHLSRHAVISNQVVVNLGDVSRLLTDNYEQLFVSTWPHGQGLLYAKAITTVWDLEVRLDHAYQDSHPVLPDPHFNQPLLMTIYNLEKEEEGDEIIDTWKSVAAYFGLARGSLLCSYKGVARLWWRDFILFLAVDSSPLISSLSDQDLRDKRIKGSVFEERAHNRDEPRHLPVPPQSVVGGAPAGMNCAKYCQSFRLTCVDADLTVVNRCTPPLTALFQCRNCLKGQDSSFPGFFHAANQCAAGGGMAGDCSATSLYVRRLCVCRKQQNFFASQLQSPGRIFTHAQESKHVYDARLHKLYAAPKEGKTSPKPSLVDVNKFVKQPELAEDDALDTTKANNHASEIAIVVIALAARQAAMEELKSLRDTLISLRRIEGIRHNQVVAAYEEGAVFTAGAIMDEGFEPLPIRTVVESSLESVRKASLYKEAVQVALDKYFQSSSSLLILEEGLRFSPDLLGYFTQLEPLLHQDKSLLCVSAFNDNGFAPYAADLTVMMRTDHFSGVAWLMSSDRLRTEMLPKWDYDSWMTPFRSSRTHLRRQCLIPEVSRAIPIVAARPGLGGNLVSFDAEAFHEGMVLCTKKSVDLGDVDRLMQERYRQLFSLDWPGEGLENSKILRSLKRLIDGDTLQDGPWRIVFGTAAPGIEKAWGSVAKFFKLRRDVFMGGAYYGVVRLRWRQSVLYLVAESSPFLNSHDEEMFAKTIALDSKDIVPALAFHSADPPLLLPPNGILLAAPENDMSCFHSCQERGHICQSEDLIFANNCPALASKFDCSACRGSTGADQPAQVYDTASATHLLCLFNMNLREFPPSCDASNKETRRLCVCRSGGADLMSAEPNNLTKTPDLPEHHLLGQLSSSATQHATPQDQQFSTSKRRPLPTLPPPPFAERLETKASELHILLIASGQRNEYLRDTLRSLAKLSGFNSSRVLVSQDAPGADAQRIVEEEFQLSWILHMQDQFSLSVDYGERVAQHYLFAIHWALKQHFNKARSLLVMEEDITVSPDFLWYFAQLEPVLHRDTTVWCIGALNNNGISPYVADPTALMRTDIFPGGAWLVSAEFFLENMTATWPEKRWDSYMKSPAGRKGRQCIVPELPRIRHYSSATNDPTSALGAAAMHDAKLFFNPDLNAMDLGDLTRITTDKYRKKFLEELHEARLLESVKELPDPFLQADKFGSTVVKPSVKTWRLHYQSDNPELDDKWRHVAAFFHLPETLPPGGMYGGIIRIRWGTGLLFIIASGALLLREAQLKLLPEAPVLPLSLQDASPPTLVPPDGEIVAATPNELGTSCTNVCHARQTQCVSADLLFINTCSVLKKYFPCSLCEANVGTDQPAFSIADSFYNTCLFNQEPLYHTPLCTAEHFNTRRLCVCRQRTKASGQVTERAPAKPAEEHTKIGFLAQPRTEKPNMKPTTSTPLDVKIAKLLHQSGWNPDMFVDAHVPHGIADFADPDAHVGKLEIRPSELAFLVVAPNGRLETLRACLTSLQQANRFVAAKVLVSLGDSTATHAMCRAVEIEFEVWCVLHQLPDLGKNSDESSHYRLALDHATTKHFIGQRSLVVLNEDVLLSQDGIWYFAQLEPLLHLDKTIWCVSAWNDAGLAPYVADPTALFRTDWHPAWAWMLSNGTAHELLQAWSEDHDRGWKMWLRSDEIRKNRQCIIPEISRSQMSRDKFGSRALHATFDELILPVMRNEDRYRINLGNVSRMLETEYQQLFINTWPGGALANSSEVTRVAKLKDINSGIWHIVVDEAVGAWASAAKYFRMWPTVEPVIRASYDGAIRIRWQGAILYVIVRSSPILMQVRLPLTRVFGPHDFPGVPPVLRGVDVSVALGRPGQSCDAVCEIRTASTSSSSRAHRDFRCHVADLLFLNACAAMKAYGDRRSCAFCTVGANRDQPSIIVTTGTVDAPANGTCMENTNLAEPPSCAAAHKHSARLCSCRALVMREIARDPDARGSTAILPATGSTYIAYEDPPRPALQPRIRVDDTVENMRCGGDFGNRMSQTCAIMGFWCCSQHMTCGNTPKDCSSAQDECRGGARSTVFCGLGWTLRLRELGLPLPAR